MYHTVRATLYTPTLSQISPSRLVVLPAILSLQVSQNHVDVSSQLVVGRTVPPLVHETYFA